MARILGLSLFSGIATVVIGVWWTFFGAPFGINPSGFIIVIMGMIVIAIIASAVLLDETIDKKSIDISPQLDQLEGLLSQDGSSRCPRLVNM